MNTRMTHQCPGFANASLTAIWVNTFIGGIFIVVIDIQDEPLMGYDAVTDDFGNLVEVPR